MKVALVHEYLIQFGGAERMLSLLCRMFPNAPIYTLFYDKEATRGVFEGRTIRTSFLDKAFVRKNHWMFTPWMPLAVEKFDFSGYDLVISLSASFAKGIITKTDTHHLCICLTPPRFLWDRSQQFVDSFTAPRIGKSPVPFLSTYLRIWDYEASLRPDTLVSISEFVKKRVQKYYRRESEVIYPSLALKQFSLPYSDQGYYLMVGRLVAYKRFDIAIEAFNELKLPLKIAGIGPEMRKLKKMAKENIEFIGSVSDDRLAELYAGARSIVFPQEEDFGIVPLEAMACGASVIAYKGGGAVETVIDKKTGLFFNEQNAKSLIKAVKAREGRYFNSDECRAQAAKFGEDSFMANLKNKIEELQIK